MRVLLTFLDTSYGQAPGHDGACEVADAAAQLFQLNVVVTVATAGKGGFIRSQDAGPFHRIEAPLLRVMPLSRAGQLAMTAVQQQNLTLLASLAGRWQAGERYDVVHCFGWEAGLASGLFCEILGIPLVVTVRDVLPGRTPWMRKPQDAYSRYVLRWLLRRCRRILCPDGYTREKLGDLFLIRGEDVIVLPPLWSDSGDARDGKRKNDPGKNILYSGPLILTRGLQEMLRAVTLHRTGDSCSVRLFLCSASRSAVDIRIRSLIRKLHLADRVFFLPPAGCARSWDRILSRVDLMVLPDPVEFIGNVALKALQRGIPVLAAGCGAMEELSAGHHLALMFSGKNGIELRSMMAAVLFHNKLPGEAPDRPSFPDRRTESEGEPMGLRLSHLYRGLCSSKTCRSKGGEKDDL